MGKNLIGQKLILSRKFQYLGIIQLQLIKFLGKLSLWVIPEDNMRS
jgi:hypothetical protein